MMPVASFLALNTRDLLVGAVAVLPTSFLYRWRDCSIAGVAQICLHGVAVLIFPLTFKYVFGCSR